MLFWASLLIEKVFNMLKVCNEPSDCRSIMAHEDKEQTEEFELSTQTDPYSQDTTRRSISELVTELAMTSLTDHFAKLGFEPQDLRPIDQIHQEAQPNPISRWTEAKGPDIPGTSAAEKEEITVYDAFHKTWNQESILGEGGDGVVYLYEQRMEQGECIAVKVPRRNSMSAQRGLLKEIKNLCMLDQHDNILGLYHKVEDWRPCGPAMFLPVCDLGDLHTYRGFWCAQQAWEGKPERISELTMWKIFRDMVLALNYIHHELGTRYVHNDFKPGNILAVTPHDYVDDTVTEEPIFKLSDFARLTPWPTPKGQQFQSFDGTPEFAPPKMEQIGPVHPSADIWGLGATLQFMALGILPIQSRKAFVMSRKAQGKKHPELKDRQEWMLDYWRARIPTVFRPIDVPMATLRKEYDVQTAIPSYQIYSARLGYWYRQLWNPVATRPKASKLVLTAIPHMTDQIERIKNERQTKRIFR